MQVYLVGGAVRDALLELPVHDKDFVVVGADFHEMMSLGFVQVGADFPVFLHPDTHFEYALARIERKNGTGYQGFATQTKGVSLADDLLRRDLTINALAIEVKGLFDDTPKTGEVIDFYGGLHDLNHKILRHISPAFGEDPLRILRTVRFFARYAKQGFSIADDTIALMQTMAQRGELSHLSRERLWTESIKAMQSGTGHIYWQTLKELGILPHLLPKLDDCWQSEHRFHAVMERLTLAKDTSIAIQFALLCSGYVNDKPKLGIELIAETTHKLNTPKYPTHIAELLCDFYQLFDKKPHADDVMRLIQRTKAHQGNLQTLHDVLTAVFIVSKKPIINKAKATDLLHRAIDVHHQVGMNDIDKSLTGKAIGLALHQLRVDNIQSLIDDIFGQLT